MIAVIAIMTMPLFISVIGGYYVYTHVQHSLRETTEETINELIPLTNLQIALISVQMPANDYLIHGNVEERIHYDQLRTELIHAFDAVNNAPFTTDQLSKLRTTQVSWQKIDYLSSSILASATPVGDKKLAEKMEILDELANQSSDIIEEIYKKIVSP